jgi:hypothetical protein
MNPQILRETLTTYDSMEEGSIVVDVAYTATPLERYVLDIEILSVCPHLTGEELLLSPNQLADIRRTLHGYHFNRAFP